jgi:hypothetical protein
MNEREDIHRIAKISGYGPVTEEQVTAAIKRARQIRTRPDEEEISRKLSAGTSSITEELALELVVTKDWRVLQHWDGGRKPPRKKGRRD